MVVRLARPVDLHIRAEEAGAVVELADGYSGAHPDRAERNKIIFPFVSVGQQRTR